MATTTRESVRTLAQALGWKPSDVISLCVRLGLPSPAERTEADLERLATALAGQPVAVLGHPPIGAVLYHRASWSQWRIVNIDSQGYYLENTETGKPWCTLPMFPEGLKQFDILETTPTIHPN